MKNMEEQIRKIEAVVNLQFAEDILAKVEKKYRKDPWLNWLLANQRALIEQNKGMDKLLRAYWKQTKTS